nr:cysteine-rich receptor-like protein kinase 10 [Quercus suber]
MASLTLNSSITLMFFSILSFLNPTTAAPGANYLYHFCANTTFGANSLYKSSLVSLLSSLSSNATHDLEFYNTTTGQNTSNPLYGLFLCRGDVSPEICQGCVAAATKDVANKCSREKVAVIWYDECMIRYSNESIFSTVDVKPRVALLNTQNISNQDQLNRLVNSTMTELAAQASDFPIGVKKFGTKEVTMTAFQTLYNLVQCTADLSSTDCNRCLQAAINRLPICCGGKQGGRVMFPSCNVRYELYLFYQTVNATPTPLTPALPPPIPGKRKISTVTIIAIIVPIAASVVLLILSYCFLRMRARKKFDAVNEENLKKSDDVLIYHDKSEITPIDTLQFDFRTIEAATNKFSENNKLGKGGFGEVYKGALSNGQEIAVKRLWKSCGQGVEQFKNEVELVAKLQHKNLARLLGLCFQGEEKILIFEFVPNKSLDYFIHEPKKQGQLDWPKRYKIIGGIARGIQYLHKDSQLKIIHRDLKASSILLDAEMNPKISDFGMAKILEVEQTQENASRIVGTYGYMSPEYAMHGEFSEKSDVYSFGILVLEIISGKKNSSFESEGAEDLLSYAWIHWRDGRPLELLDSTLRDSNSVEEVLRCIQISLLCVQKDPTDRPTMASIILMLNGHSVTLPSPQEPAFFLHSNADPNMPVETDLSTVKEASVTELDPR